MEEISIAMLKGVRIHVKTYLPTAIIDGPKHLPILPPVGSTWSFATGILGELVEFIIAKYEFSTLIKPYRCDDCDEIHTEEDGVNITARLEPLSVNEKLIKHFSQWLENTGLKEDDELDMKELSKEIQETMTQDKPHPFLGYFRAAESIEDIEYALMLLIDVANYLSEGRLMGLTEDEIKEHSDVQGLDPEDVSRAISRLRTQTLSGFN